MKSTSKLDLLPPRRQPPATTPEARDNQLISKAYDLVERRIDEGTATSQETTHFLKLGSARARLEQETLEAELQLIKAKTESLQSAKRFEELYSNAIEAMRTYSGAGRRNDDY